ncbi:adhesive plaque matrix protein-like isoform X1 [Schistocerca americana]|uniref:adhesive plaque matrix protein-like isoform X1 n=1 Tax=Schistocerca americana TaxID=7009 RepID=UPI001F502569|nr:adhesive plaque matrix protein-like isoform X1 [Schistocerca americana]
MQLYAVSFSNGGRKKQRPATAVVFVTVLLMVGRCTAVDPEAADNAVEDPGAAVGAAGEELVKESRLGAKASPRSRFPAAMIGYNRYYPEYSPDFYYPPGYPRYYPSYPNNYYPTYPTVNYPPVNYPTNNYYPTGYPPYYPYDYVPYGSGVNEYSARHERA